MTSLLDPPRSAGSTPDPEHAVSRFGRSLNAALEEVSAAAVWSMTPSEQRQTLVDLAAAKARLEELRLRVLAQADRDKVGADSGATSMAAWLGHQVKATTASCFADLHLAQALDGEFEVTRRAMAGCAPTGPGTTAGPLVTGESSTEQSPVDRSHGFVDDEKASHGVVDAEKARIIVRAVRTLTEEHGDLVDTDVRRRAEGHLVDLALQFDAPTLRQMAKRLFEVVCPEAADAAEAEKLAREEEAARRAAYLTLHDNGDGTTEGRFRLPTLHAHLLKKALQTLTSPRRIGQRRVDPETGKKLSASTLLGHGLMDLLENHLDLESMPTVHGSPFSLVVSIGLDSLQTGLGVAVTDTGHRISAGEARRLSCKAGIIPMVLGSDSVPLDVGREQRFFTKAQKVAINHRYGNTGCAAVNCDRPPDWVEFHHEDAWQHGGRTDHKLGMPLCPPHHHMADNPRVWSMTKMPSGGVRFTRRT